VPLVHGTKAPRLLQHHAARPAVRPLARITPPPPAAFVEEVCAASLQADASCFRTAYEGATHATFTACQTPPTNHTPLRTGGSSLVLPYRPGPALTHSSARLPTHTDVAGAPPTQATRRDGTITPNRNRYQMHLVRVCTAHHGLRGAMSHAE